jgi:hypothetical protein
VEAVVGVIVGTALNIGTTVFAVFEGILAAAAGFIALSYIAEAINLTGCLAAWGCEASPGAARSAPEAALGGPWAGILRWGRVAAGEAAGALCESLRGGFGGLWRTLVWAL